ATQNTIVDFLNLVAGVQRGLTVTVTSQGPCMNDECGLPTPAVLGLNPLAPGSGAFSNVGATTSLGYPAICAPLATDVWFLFAPPESGTYQIDTNVPYGFAPPSLADTVVAVYASCAPALPLACDNDSGAGLLSSLTVPLSAGSSYYIRVGGTAAGAAGQGT